MAGWIRPGNETTMHFLCCPLSPQVALPCMAGYLPSKRKKPSELRYRSCRKEKGIPGILRCRSHRNIGQFFSAKVDVEKKFHFCIL